MKKTILNYSRCLFILLGFAAFDVIAQNPVLVNPDATQEAKDVYNYIYNVKYQGIITGQHNYAQTWLSDSETAIRASKLVKDNIGEWPGLWGSDFSFTDPNYTIEQLQEARQKMINVAKAQAAAGSLITLTYHMVTPKLEENQGWTNVQQARLTMEEYEQLVTPGTELYNNWKRNLDRVIPFLKELENEGIAVVWRPYHEMNGLFWWGGGESAKTHFKQLWINTYEYMVNNPDPTMQLNNLIWFWSPNHFTSWNNDRAPLPWFPGLEYVDMLGVDDYWWTQEGFLSQGDYDYLVNLAEGKPLAIGEGFNPNMVIPDPEWMMEHRPEYRWFMLWDGEWINDRINDPVRKAALTEIYQHENAINQGNVHVPATDIEDVTPPSIPANLKTTNLEWNTVSLAWDAATDENGVSGYEIFVNGVYKKFTFDLFTTLSSLTSATEYTFTVKARDHYMNRSALSAPLVVETPVFEATPPTVPQNFKSIGRSETTISLTWEAASSNSTITGYEVYVNGTLNKTVTTLGTTITDLPQGEEFNLSVKAANEAGQLSEASEILVISTYNPGENTVKVNDTEFTFNGTWGTSSGAGKYMNDDHWSNTTDAFYTYTFTGTSAYVMAAKAPHHGIAGISLNGGEEVMVDYYSGFRIDETIVYETGELPLGIYTIKVRVSGTRNPNSTGEVIAADRLDFIQGEGEDDVPPTKPTDLAVTARTHNSVSLSWTASTDNNSVFGYDIYVDGENKMTTPNTTATVSGLLELTTYSFTVVAKDGFGNESEASDAVEATTRENLETNLVMNGGFESYDTEFNDAHFWFDDNKNGNAALETTEVFAGEKAIKLGPGNWGWISQRLTGWEAGKTYVLSAYGKVAAAGNSVRISGKFNSTDLENMNFTSTDYTLQSIQITIPEEATSFQIYLTNRSTGTGFIDNVSFALLDEEVPTTPTNLEALEVTTSSVTLAWSPSTDNVVVVGYEIFVNGEFKQALEDTTAVVTGLSEGTAYTFTVVAKDGSNNVSVASEPLEVTTDTTPEEVPLSVGEEARNSAGILKVFPNAFENELVVQIINGEKLNGDMPFTIYNLAGVIVYQGKLTRKSEYSQTIDTSNLSSGVYILRVMGRAKLSSLIMKK